MSNSGEERVGKWVRKEVLSEEKKEGRFGGERKMTCDLHKTERRKLNIFE